MMESRSYSLALILVVLVGGAGIGVCGEKEATPQASGGNASPSPTPIVIDNETLKKYADQGNVTTVEKPGRERGVRSSGPSAPITTGEDPREAERRRYWRTQYEKQLELVESLEQQIALLNNEIPGLWRDFYARDDPMYRDGVIKPKLDEALARWDRMTKRLEQERAKLPKIREDARRDGALPGWFRGLDTPKSGAADDQDKTSGDRLPTEFDVEVVTADDTSD